MAVPQTTVITLTTRPDLTRRHKVYRYVFQFVDPGTPTYPTGGIPVDLTTAINSTNWYRAKWASASLPLNDNIELISAPGILTLVQNSVSPTLKNFLMKFFNAGAELNNGTNIPAAFFSNALATAPHLVFDIRGSNFN